MITSEDLNKVVWATDLVFLLLRIVPAPSTDPPEKHGSRTQKLSFCGEGIDWAFFCFYPIVVSPPGMG